MKNIVYTCLKGVLFVVSLVPLRGGYAFSSLLYFLLRHIVKYRKKVIAANLRLVFPDMSESEIAVITKKYYRHLSEVFVELMYSLYIPEKIIRKRIRFV
ncbi:MAG: lipid A biosynthesis acyltransferase, partial [Prevotellaceae bacterium]|nr:lipid A biosynthesis acyltransferase [Prevotellaceae bacterium]